MNDSRGGEPGPAGRDEFEFRFGKGEGRVRADRPFRRGRDVRGPLLGLGQADPAGDLRLSPATNAADESREQVGRGLRFGTVADDFGHERVMPSRAGESGSLSRLPSSPGMAKAKATSGPVKNPFTGRFAPRTEAVPVTSARSGRSPSFGEWSPSFQDFAVVAGADSNRGFSVDEDAENRNWHRPPDSSHLERFSIFDYPRANSNLARARREAAAKPFRNPFTGRIEKRQSTPEEMQKPTHRVIAVIFEAKGRWPRSEYWYFFSDFGKAQETYDAMVEEESPGKIIHSVMIAEGIPYRKVA